MKIVPYCNFVEKTVSHYIQTLKYTVISFTNTGNTEFHTALLRRSADGVNAKRYYFTSIIYNMYNIKNNNK